MAVHILIPASQVHGYKRNLYLILHDAYYGNPKFIPYLKSKVSSIFHPAYSGGINEACKVARKKRIVGERKLKDLSFGWDRGHWGTLPCEEAGRNEATQLPLTDLHRPNGQTPMCVMFLVRRLYTPWIAQGSSWPFLLCHLAYWPEMKVP